MARRNVTTNGNGRSYEGLPDFLTLNRIEQMVANTPYTQPWVGREWFAKLTSGLDPRRDIDDECGYPKTTQLTAQHYQELYERDPIANRVVNVWPREAWQTQPEVFEDETSETSTEFEEAWDELNSSLRGVSWYKTEEGSPVFEYLKRGHEQCRIGHYGVIFLGIDDNLPLDQPVKGIKEDGSFPKKVDKEKKDDEQAIPVENFRRWSLKVNAEETKGRKLTHLRVFPEYYAQVTQWEANPTSPRFGQPVMYQLTFNDPSAGLSGIGLTTQTRNVHWTRVVHLADNLASNEVIGVPACRPVLNSILDLRKIRGAGAEGYWKGAFMGMSLETHPQLGGDVEIDEDSARDQMEQYFNGLQRYLAIPGLSAKTLAPAITDPTPYETQQIQTICIQMGIPQRIFLGSERGELASTQDDAAWNDRLKEYQNSFITPRIVVPFVDRLIMVGVLPQPKEYFVYWPDITSTSATERVQVFLQKVQAYGAYLSSGIDQMIPAQDFMTKFDDFSDEEAEAILEAAVAQAEATMEYDEAHAEEMGFEEQPPEGFEKPLDDRVEEAEKMSKATGKPAFGGPPKPGNKPFGGK